MSFWNENFYFEKRGDRYVYRPTVFSAGFDISESEKNQLFEGLMRLQWRTLLEAGIATALIALVFMVGVIKTDKPIPLFLICSILAVIILGVTILQRRDRLVNRVLRRRSPDVPRLPFRQALVRPRAPVGRHIAIPVLKCVVFMFGLAIAAGDGFCAYLIFRAYRAREIAEGPEETAAVKKFFSLTVDNMEFWAGLALFNVFLFACILLLVYQLRCLRAVPDPDRN